MTKKFLATFGRTESGKATTVIEASSLEEAQRIAHDDDGDLQVDFDADDAVMELWSVEEIDG